MAKNPFEKTLKVKPVKATKARPQSFELWDLDGKVMVDAFGSKEALLEQADHHHWRLIWPTVWSKETPTTEGWYWCKYKNKRNKFSVCPCEVTIFSGPGLKGTHVRSAYNTTWMEGPNHGGPGLKYDGKLDTSLRFGPRIEEYDA